MNLIERTKEHLGQKRTDVLQAVSQKKADAFQAVNRTRGYIENIAHNAGTSKDSILQQVTYKFGETKITLSRKTDEVLQGTKEYLTSVADRSIGREAWNNALQNPIETDPNIKVSLLRLDYHPLDEQKPRSKKKSKNVLTLFTKYNNRAAIGAMMQAATPVLYRFALKPAMYNERIPIADDLPDNRLGNVARTALSLGVLSGDVAIWGTALLLSLDKDYSIGYSFLLLRGAGNIAAQVGMDAGIASFYAGRAAVKKGRDLNAKVKSATNNGIKQLSTAAESMASRLDNNPTLQKGTELVLTTAEKIRSFISPRIQQP